LAHVVPDPEVESTLVSGERQGPARARLFDSIYREGFSYVVQSLRRLGVGEKDLADLAHDTFVLVYARLGDFDPARPLKPWLFAFAFRLASDYRKRARAWREVPSDAVDAPSDAPAADVTVEEAQSRELVLRALGSVEIERRAVFVMHEIDEVPVPEIARALSIPVNTAYSRLRLARDEFQSAVKRLRPGWEKS
jgi:RNA polymerase sigma-70 factor (ECF subfamily)